MEPIKLSDFNRIYMVKQFESELNDLLAGSSLSAPFRTWFIDVLMLIDKTTVQDAIAQWPRRIEHIEGNIYAITFRKKEKNIRVLFASMPERIELLCCAFEEKRSNDYLRAVKLAKQRSEGIQK